MKLAAMDLENFRCFEKLHIEFDERLTVLVGANGAGKTAILKAVSFFSRGYAIEYARINLPFAPEIYSFDYCQATDIHSKYNKGNIEFTPVFSGGQDGRVPTYIEIEKNPNTTKAAAKINYSGTNLRRSMPYSVVVCYSASREVDGFEQNEKAPQDTPAAYATAFNPQIDFSAALAWFIKKASEEALEAVRIKDMNHKLADLSATRAAIAQALGDYDEPYVAKTPPDLFITHKNAPDTPLTLRQLSDGYRTMLALVMDLARRMAVANADAEWPEGQTVLHSPGIVLIDEVEQHLHPAWQQTVLPRLIDIFPNVQFIVTTHSPQVLTSIKAKHIRILRDGAVYTFPEETDGAEAGRVLEDVLGVSPRPDNEAARKLKAYEEWVNRGEWDAPEAARLKRELEAHYGDSEPKLDELALRVETMKWERGL